MYNQWWDNGKKKFQFITNKDGIIDKYISWYENGQKSSEGNYKNGKPVLCNSWDENGEITVKDGNGKDTFYDKNGKILQETLYSNYKEHVHFIIVMKIVRKKVKEIIKMEKKMDYGFFGLIMVINI